MEKEPVTQSNQSDSQVKEVEPVAQTSFPPDSSGESVQDTVAVDTPYEKFKLPEGETYDEQAGEEFGSLCKELKLSQSQAQKLVDKYSDVVKANREKVRQQMDSALGELNQSWLKSTKEAWGGDFEKKSQMASSALSLASDSLIDLLNGRDKKLPGVVLGDHPAVAEFLAKVGELAKTRPLFQTGSLGTKQEKPVTDVLYGKVDV